MSDVVVVGASIAGFTVAEALRARGHGGRIRLLGAEPHAPYSRPPLTKRLLAGGEPPQPPVVADAARLRELDVEFLPGTTVHRADLRRKVVATDAGETAYDVLVAATGAGARALPELPQARTVRTIDDAVEVGARLEGARRVVVVGGGVLACELAAAARMRGAEVALLARGGALRLGTCGALVDQQLSALLSSRGVDVRRGVAVVGVETADTVSRLRLSDGATVDGDLVLAAVGARPRVDWLAGNGLDLADGIRCDASGGFAPDAYAVGDVAAWPAPHGGVARVEHQTRAIEHALAVAATICGETPADLGPAYFWSELFDVRIQAVGEFPPGAAVRVLAGDVGAGRFVLAVEHEGRDRGVIGWAMPREFRAARASLDPVAGALR